MEDTEVEFSDLVSTLVDDLFVNGVLNEQNIEPITKIMNQLASMLEHQERLFMETTNNPLADEREHFGVGKLLQYINEDVTDNIINKIIMPNHANKPLFFAALRFLVAASPAVYSSVSHEEIVPTLMEMMKQEGDERIYAIALISAVTLDSEASNVAVKERLPERMITRLQDVLQKPPKRPKFTNDVTGLTREELEYIEFRSCIATLSNLADYQDFLAPCIRLDLPDTINILLQIPDKFIILETLRLIHRALTHNKFASMFLEKGGFKLMLKLPKMPFLSSAMGDCFVSISLITPIMDKITQSAQYVEKMTDFAISLLSSNMEAKKSGCLFFHSALSYKTMATRLDKVNALELFTNVLRMPASFPDDVQSGKQISHCASLAIRSYLRIHLLLAGINLEKKSKLKKQNKYMDLQRIASNDTIMAYLDKNMSQLVPSLQRSRWKPASQILELKSLEILLDVLNASAFWKATNVAQCILEIIQLITFAPFTHVPLCEIKLDTGRTGLGLILETASLNTDVEVVMVALKVLVNLASMESEFEERLHIPDHRRRVWELVRANDGIRVLIGLLRFSAPPHADTVRYLVCRILIGLAQDEGLNQILRAVDLPVILSDLFKEPINSEHMLSFKKFKECALRLLGMVSGRTDHLQEARDPVMVRLEKAAIVANTNITYHDSELLKLIHDYLKTKGMTNAANTLAKEAKLTTGPENANLETIVTSYLRHQHRECVHPITTLPPLSLLKPHRCPVPRQETGGNLINRLRMRESGQTRSRLLTQKDRKYIYSRFRHVGTFRDEEAEFITCANFCPITGRLFCGTDYGDLLVFTHPEMIELETIDLGNTSKRYALGAVINGIRPSFDGKHILTWLGHSEAPCVKLFKTGNLDAESPVYEWIDARNALFSHAGDMVVGTNARQTLIWDVNRGDEICKLVDPQVMEDFDYNVACFDQYDEVVLSDAVLWDFRSTQIIHRFDRLTRASSGVFHPNGNEIIINSEVWDVRNFKLLRTVPSLSNTRSITFSPSADTMYAIYRKNSEQENMFERNSMMQEAMKKRNEIARQKNVFRTIDAVTYQSISTIDVEREIMDLAPSPDGHFVALVMDDAQADSSTCRLYEVGRRRRGGDEEEDDSDDSESDMSDSEIKTWTLDAK